MIKLKELLNENVKPEDIRVYWNFILNALSGKNPDDFYRQHTAGIDMIAKELTRKYGSHSGTTVYRGIILDPSEVKNGTVQHIPEVTYVSFSTDKKIAIAFGDTENPMAEFLMSRFPNKKGYLITQKYSPNLLLFHHLWLEPTKMLAAVRHIFGDAAKYIEMQKEVILKPEPQYKVEPIVPGSSGGLEVGT